MERTLQVLDYAVLVVSGTDGIQAHTLTLWRLLERYQIPVFLFINKMDLPGADADVRMAELRRRLSEGCLAFDRMDDAFYEAAALTEESAMDEYLTDGALSEETLRGLIAGRRIFPCYFGSALRLSGVEELIAGLERWIQPAVWPASFGAKVYKISRDTQGARLTHLKVTGGVLRVRDLLTGCRPGGSDAWRKSRPAAHLFRGKYTTVNESRQGGCVPSPA